MTESMSTVTYRIVGLDDPSAVKFIEFFGGRHQIPEDVARSIADLSLAGLRMERRSGQWARIEWMGGGCDVPRDAFNEIVDGHNNRAHP